MPDTILIFDGNYLAHRAFHTTGSLSYKGKATGVAYGFFKSVVEAMDLYQTDKVCFCFDHGKGLREKDVPSYKAKRRLSSIGMQERARAESLKEQIRELREEFLPQIVGEWGVVYEDGYEADDLIAQVAGLTEDFTVVVSADKDLYQLLFKGSIVIFDPRQKVVWTQERFQEVYKIRPSQWVEVKSIAGCVSDNVIGCKSVGEKTALQFVSGDPTLSIVKKSLIQAWVEGELYRKNLELVSLPYKNCPVPEYFSGTWDTKKFRKIAYTLGMRTLVT
jgi:DNA polymerase-1